MSKEEMEAAIGGCESGSDDESSGSSDDEGFGDDGVENPLQQSSEEKGGSFAAMWISGDESGDGGGFFGACARRCGCLRRLVGRDAAPVEVPEADEEVCDELQL